MSTSSTRMRTAVLRLTVVLYCWLRTHHSVFAANITVQHTDPSIVYSPVESWLSNSDLCSTCLVPGIFTSYHEGINSALGVVSTSSSSTPTASSSLSSMPTASLSSSSTSTAASSSSSTVTPTTSSNSSSAPTSSLSSPPPAQTLSPPSTTHDNRGSSHDSPGKDERALAQQLIRPRLGINNPDFGDIPVTLSYNFTGTAIYVFCIQPLGEVAVGGTLTNTNLTFTLDNQPAGNFAYTGTPGSTGFVLNKNILSLDGLSDQPHQLVVTVGNDSVFLFNHLIYTDNSVETSTSAIRDKRHDIATFAGALGGSVGVLSLFSLGIAISIIRRRMLAARRDRLDNEANAINDTTPMSGPMSFVPRYFPDTIIPQDPPTYNDALSSTNHNSTPLLASISSSEHSSRQRSYADIPPASPPPLLEEIPPPPPFPLSLLSAPTPSLPIDVTPSPVSAENQTSDSPDVGNSFTCSHEDTPLLQSSDSDIRPRSRMSIRSLEPPENLETNNHQEGTS